MEEFKIIASTIIAWRHPTGPGEGNQLSRTRNRVRKTLELFLHNRIHQGESFLNNILHYSLTPTILIKLRLKDCVINIALVFISLQSFKY